MVTSNVNPFQLFGSGKCQLHQNVCFDRRRVGVSGGLRHCLRNRWQSPKSAPDIEESLADVSITRLEWHQPRKGFECALIVMQPRVAQNGNASNQDSSLVHGRDLGRAFDAFELNRQDTHQISDFIARQVHIL